MKAVAFVNGKGGAGKTTCAVHAAAYLAKQGFKTVLIDADALTWRATWWLDPNDELGFDHMQIADPRKLANQLEVLKSKAYQVAVVDTPPALQSQHVWEAVHAVDLVVVPSKNTMLDLSMAIDTANRAVRQTETRLMLAQVDPHSLTEAYTALSTLKATGLEVLSTPVRAYKAHERAAGEHVTVFEYEERGLELTKPRRDVAQVGQEIERLLRLKRRG